tara:strand:- start:325 stop:1314 length:990 start_codon:yes stop_codon:yes gene_type:complete
MIYKSYLLEQNFSTNKEKCFLFYGENLGLKNEFKHKLKLNNKNTEFYRYNEEEIIKNEDSFFNEILNSSLFADKKIYIIENVSDKILDTITRIENKLENKKLFFFSKNLDKKSKLRNFFEKSKNHGCVACYPDNETTIKNIIIKRLAKFDGLSQQVINILVENSNLDRVKLNNELIKIKTYFLDGKIDINKLVKLINYRNNDDFTNLKDEALKGNKISTNKLLNETFLETEKSVFYLSSLNLRLNKIDEVLQMSESKNIEDSVSSLKPPVFWKDKPNFMMQIRKWNRIKIKMALKQLYDLELYIKSKSNTARDTLIKKLLVDLCNLANS